MYRIETASFGYKLTFGDFIGADEMKKWVEESKEKLKTAANSFGVLIDMRTLKPLPKESQPVMQDGQKAYKGKGMQRSAVILNDAITTAQFKRIAQETGIYQWERYFDASKVTNWQKVAEDWVARGIDPDAK